MTLDRKWATGAGDGGDPQGTGTPQATDPNAEKEALQREVERLKGAVEQGKAEKGTLEETKQALAAAEARIVELESNGVPPTPATQTNPAQRLLDEIAYYSNIVAGNPNDVAHQRLLRNAQAELAGYQWQAFRARELPKLQAADARFRDEAIRQFDTGGYSSAELAINAAKGIVLEREAGQNAAERARQEAADRAAAAAAANKPDTGGGSGSDPNPVSKKQSMTGTEFNRRTASRTPESIKLMKDVDQGLVEVDFSR